MPFSLPVTINFETSLTPQQIDSMCLGVINPTTVQWECRDTNLQSTTSNGKTIVSGKTNTFSDYALLVNYQQSASGSSTKSSSNGSTLAIIAGCVAVGAIIIVGSLIAVMLYLSRKRRREQSRQIRSNQFAQ